MREQVLEKVDPLCIDDRGSETEMSMPSRIGTAKDQNQKLKEVNCFAEVLLHFLL